MSDDQTRRRTYETTLQLLKPALERVASDPEFRARFEQAPLEVLDELGVELDPATRAELTGKRFSQFWAARRQAVEGPLEVRDLPPADGSIDDQKLEASSAEPRSDSRAGRSSTSRRLTCRSDPRD